MSSVQKATKLKTDGNGIHSTSTPLDTPKDGAPPPKPKRRVVCRAGFYHVDTKGMCLLCYRERSAKRRNQEFSARFCKMILRYLKMEFQQNVAKPSNLVLKKKRLKKVGIELCEDCSFLAANFCKMYSEFEIMQMKLDACVKSISNIMNLAARIPSRIKAYQERMGVLMGVEEKDSNFKGFKSQAIAIKTVTVAQNFRKALIQKCSEKYKSSSPCVRLRRINQLPPQSSILNATPFRGSSLVPHPSTNLVSKVSSSSSSSNLNHFLLAHSLTFAIVWNLASSPLPSSRPNANKFVAGGPSSDISLNYEPQLTTRNFVGSSSRLLGAERQHPNEGNRTEEPEKFNPITITTSGNTILLRQNVKLEQMFVDESESFIEDYDNCDMMNGAQTDGFFGGGGGMEVEAANSLPDNLEPSLIQEEQMQHDSSNSSPVIDINDRTCRECRIQLSCRAELEKHRVQIHKLTSYVECPVCKDMFTSYFALKRHRDVNDTCEISEEAEILEFETIAKPIFPYSNTVRGNKFCPLEGCFEVFVNQEALDLHLKAHGMFPCSICKDKFEKAHDLALHEAQKHSDQSGYKCTRCKFNAGYQHSYVTHFVSTHLDIAVYGDRCEICQRGFLKTGRRTTEEKKAHFITHHDVEGKLPEEVFTCTICKAPFLKKQQLKSHLQHIHHVEQEAKFKCTECPQGFVSSLLLRKHKLKEHENLSDIDVEIILKQKMQTKLAANRKIKMKCEYCELSFSSKTSYLLHVQKHKLENQTVNASEDTNNCLEEMEVSSTEASEAQQDPGTDKEVEKLQDVKEPRGLETQETA